MLTVLSSATGEWLTTLGNVKEALNIDDEQYDEQLKRYITRASKRIEAYLDRPLSLQVYQAFLPAFGRTALQLPAVPVRTILRVFDSSATGTASELSSTEYRLDKERGWLMRDEGFAWTFQEQLGINAWPEAGQEAPMWLVEWSAGYILPAGKDSGSTGDGTTSTDSTLDPSLEDACIETVRGMWDRRGRQLGVASVRVGDLAVTYKDGGVQGLSDEIASLLSRFRSVY